MFQLPPRVKRKTNIAFTDDTKDLTEIDEYNIL